MEGYSKYLHTFFIFVHSAQAASRTLKGNNFINMAADPIVSCTVLLKLDQNAALGKELLVMNIDQPDN